MEPKEKIENYLEREQQERYQKEYLERFRKQQEETARTQAEYNRNVVKLGRTFKCHHCGIPARIPLEYDECESIGFGSGPDINHVVCWKIPGDLKQCCVCSNWFCQEHGHEYHGKYFCIKCVEKM